MSRAEKARNTILEMYSQRGYTEIKEEENKIYGTTLNGNRVCCFTSIIEKLNISEVQSHIVSLQAMGINHGILLHEGTPTPPVKNVITTCPDMGMELELFHANNLQYNPTKHFLVPKHELMSSEDVKKVKSKFDIKCLPRIKEDDPISLFYNFKKGDLIRVHRGTGICYRLVR
jgi:DNA-directed RNA polymerase I, II, and III subunit RPABC1